MIIATKNYSTSQAAAELGVHRNTIMNWCKAGYLKFGVHRVNGRKFFRGADLIRCYNS